MQIEFLHHIFCWRCGRRKRDARNAAEATLAEDGFDPSTSGLWAQHASAAPLCYLKARALIAPIESGLRRRCPHVCMQRHLVPGKEIAITVDSAPIG